MAAETADIRNKARRAKDLALTKAIEILEGGEPVYVGRGKVPELEDEEEVEDVEDFDTPPKRKDSKKSLESQVTDIAEYVMRRKIYFDTFQTVLKNAVPRMTVLNGDDDGGPIEVKQITGMKVTYKDPSGHRTTAGNKEPEASASV